MEEKIRFNLNTPSAYSAATRSLAELTKPKLDPDDPAPDLTLRVAANLARDEHPRKHWSDYNFTQQATYISNAEFIIVNVLRFARHEGYTGP